MKLGRDRSSIRVCSSRLTEIKNTCSTGLTVALTAAVLALSGMPGTAAPLDEQVYLFGAGGAYYAAGYSVGGGHVSDPLGIQVGTVDGNGNIVANGSIIGFIAVGA